MSALVIVVIIGILGYFMLRMTAFSGHHRRRSRQEGNQLPILALGAGLMAVGFFGTFFGNLIKAAVSRQREFLADASAVQFTRQPGGLAGALKTIGGLASGSAIQSPNAPEASHLFFGRATRGLSGLFSTHPRLPTRIRRIDPSWDGSFPEVAPVLGGVSTPRPSVPGVAGLADDGAAALGVGARVAHAIDHIGHPSAAHIRYAAGLVNGQRFKQNVNQLVQADDAIDPFEWSLHRIVLHELETDRSNVVPARVRHHTLAPLQPQCELLLSILARAGQRDTAAAAQAFEHGWRGLNLPQRRLRRADGNGLAALDAALAAIEEAAPRVKRQILQAAVACITADDTVTATEAELLRAFSTSLGCPMPPLLLT